MVALAASAILVTSIACSLSTNADDLTGGNQAVGEAGADGAPGLDASDDGSVRRDDSEAPRDGVSGDNAASTAYRDAVLADHPVDYWRLGDLPGSKSANNLGGPHPGVVNGTVVLGAAGALLNDSDGAFEFSANGYLSVNGAFSFVGSIFSAELWIRPKFSDSTNRFALGKATYYPDVSGFEVLVQDGIVCGAIAQQSNFGKACAGIPVNEFSHVAFTYDLSKCRAYVNGVLKDEQDCSAFTVSLAAPDLTLGAFAPAMFPLEGALDEVAIYDHVLPVERVAAHFHASGR